MLFRGEQKSVDSRKSRSEVAQDKAARGAQSQAARRQAARRRTARGKAIATRVAACAIAVTLGVFCQAPLLGADNAFGADGKSADAASAGKSANAAKNDKSSDSQSGSLSAGKQDKEDKEAKEKEEAAAKKYDEADKLFAQAEAKDAAIDEAQAAYDAAVSERDRAVAQRDEANQRLGEEKQRLSELQEDLSDFVVGMYKQGGVTPYLDVALRATTYQEFLHSWNALVTIYERGESMADEKRAIQNEIEGEIAQYEEQIKNAERSMAIADSKRRQARAAQLGLLIQAWDKRLEGAEIKGDKEEIAKAKEEAEKARAALDDAISEGLAGESVLIGDGVFTHPCPASTVSSGFGYREFDHSVHKGLDLAAPEGTPYYAAESGTVVAATNGGGDNGGAGNWIVIEHEGGLVTKYMHSLVTFVQVGDHVERGQNIGLVGNTGNSTGPHLHFQVEVDGTAIDPAPFLRKAE